MVRFRGFSERPSQGTGGEPLTTAIGITLLVGFTIGMFFGVPLGRAWERLRPTKKKANKQP